MDSLQHSLHDASIEAVTVGPRREVELHLDLGSARISDPALPEEAVLHLSDIDNFDEVRVFFETDFGEDPISRIDQVIFSSSAGGAVHSILFELDPQGVVDVKCSKFDLVAIGDARDNG
ncbi:MAG: hypothetical protein AAF581_10215 [Planctomycetota bacterium]